MPPVRNSISKLNAETAEEYAGIKALTDEALKRNATPEVDAVTLEMALEKFQASLARSNDDLYDFLASVYAAYVSARANDRLDELLNAFCPEDMKGISARTHPIAKLIKGVLGEKGQSSNSRRTILEWKNCLCWLLVSNAAISDARTTLSEHGVSALAFCFSESLKTERDVKKAIPKLRFDKSIKEDIDNIISKGGIAQAIIKVSEDGTLLITKIRKKQEKTK